MDQGWQSACWCFVINEGLKLIQFPWSIAFLLKFMRNRSLLPTNYQCLQIAHIINQLATKSQDIAAIFIQDTKFTMCKLWERLKSFLTECELKESDLIVIKHRFQIRLIWFLLVMLRTLKSEKNPVKVRKEVLGKKIVWKFELLCLAV